VKGLRLLLTTIAMATACAGSTSAQTGAAAAPTDVIGLLNTVCIAAQGDAAVTRTLAMEAGFSAAPSSLAPPIRNASDIQMLVRSTETDAVILMTGKITRRVGRDTVVMDACALSVRPTDHRALDQRLRGLIGFAPVRLAGLEAYAWLQTPEGRAPTRALSDPQFVSMARTGQMRMIAIDRQGEGSSLAYFLPRID